VIVAQRIRMTESPSEGLRKRRQIELRLFHIATRPCSVGLHVAELTRRDFCLAGKVKPA
jgi:hypothetical protein